MITDIAHICIAAKDLAETEQFYCEGLGLKKAFDFIRAGQRIGFYLQTSRGRYIEVFQHEQIEPCDRHPIIHICLQTDDLDQLRSHLVAMGIKVTEKKLGADNSYQAWVTDPSGVKIEFHQYTQQSSQLTGRDCILE